MNPNLRNHEIVLRESIKHFLTSYHNGNTDFSSFESIFFRLIQTMLDPPLEITWFYSAITFHAAKSTPQGKSILKRVVAAKDLLNLLISCSNLSCASKKIALLAPVVYETYNIVYDCKKNDVCVRTELEKLVESVVDYASMCVGVRDFGNGVDDCDGALVCFEDLVRVWVVDRVEGSCCAEDDLRAFFPGMSDATWKGMRSQCGVHELVGIVLCELFLLRMHSSFGSKMREVDTLEVARNQALQSMKGFQNWYFLDMLFKMLSEPSLPIAALLSSKDAIILHKSLYDAVMLFDYSFYTGRWIQSLDNRSKRLAILWVLIADRAFQFARNITDPGRANSYLHAFHQSQLAIELIEWASCQEDMLQQKARPEILNPQSLIGWLLVLEDRGINVFDSNEPNIREKAETCLYLSRTDAGFCLVNMVKINFNRKRKEAMLGQIQASRVKQLKLGSSSNGDKSVLLGSSGGGEMKLKSEVKALTFDDDMIIG